MTVMPQTTPVPNPLVLMSKTSSAAPTTTPVPPQAPDKETEDGHQGEDDDSDFQQPKLRLEIRDLQHPGATKFLASVNAATVLSTAVGNVQRLLYHSPAEPHTTLPPTRSVTVILRDMGGVAYTTGVNTYTSELPAQSPGHFSKPLQKS